MFLLLNALSRFVIDFLPRSKSFSFSWLQSQSAVILELKKIKSATVSTFSQSLCHEVMGPDTMIFVFWLLSFKPAFSLSSFTFINRLFSFYLLSAIRVVSSPYMRLLILLPAILISAWASSSLAFHMIYSACKLNIQDDNIQPWHTPFPILNQSVVPCLALTIASWPAYRFLRRQGRWSDISISLRIFPQFVVIHTVKGFGVVNKAEIYVFLDLFCFFYDPVDVGNLISGSFIFSKSSLYTWRFSFHILLKHSLKDFKHYLASMWNECNCSVVWTFFGIVFLWDSFRNMFKLESLEVVSVWDSF